MTSISTKTASHNAGRSMALVPYAPRQAKRKAESIESFELTPHPASAKRQRTDALLEQALIREVPRGLLYRFSATGPLRGLGPNFVGGQVISTDAACLNRLKETGALADSMVEVHATLPGEHTWAKHGFEYRVLPDHFQRVLTELSTREPGPAGRQKGLQNRARLREKVTTLMTEWGRLQGFGPYTIALTVDSVDRDTGGSAQFGAVNVLHNDFPNKPREILATFKNEWKPKVELSLQRKLTDDEYLNLDIKSINNIWMPTCDVVTRDHLAMLSTASTKPGDAAVYTATRRNRQGFEAEVVRIDPERHEFFLRYAMRKGECVIFSTSGQQGAAGPVQGCGHSSWSAPGDFGVTRTSMEVRALYVNLGRQGYAEHQGRWDEVRRTGRRFV